MGLIHSPSVITDGLVLALDAQNSRSYPGSGTAWTDITYRGNNGTLTNGPTFEPGGPFAGSAGGSVYFDGTGDYLSLNANSAFSFGIPSGNSNDFTIEWFKYWTTLSGFQTIWSNNYSYNPGLLIQTGNSDGKYRIYVSSNTLLFQETDAPVVGVWYHYALVRNGTTITLYRNGVSNGSGTSSNAAGSASNATTIGTSESGPLASYFENGYISNFRIVKGTALYTSNFTPPTKPLLPVTNTSLLTCQGGAIVDSSSNKFTITRNGDARAVKTAAINLDGTNDYVNCSITKTATCTFSCWARTTASLTQPMLFNAGPDGQGPDLFFYNGKISWNTWDGDANSFGNIPANANNGNYHYYVVVNDASSNTKLYYDNSLLGTATYKNASLNTNLTIGGNTNTYQWNGSISNFQLYNRALTATEVSQNFNAMRNRFGI